MEEGINESNQYRKGHYRKDEKAESFLIEFNKYLFEKEKEEYKDYSIGYPFIFVIGLPRSGTTLLTQLIANSFDISFINNLAARFFLAPLHGIRFAYSVLGHSKKSDFKSDYARTSNLEDIHEFGYFWKHWLQKHTLDDVVKAKESEKNIDWDSLRKILSSLQNETQKPFVFKNIYSSYHISKITELLKKVIFVYIERDELDVAVSILNARKKYNSDLNVWWSYQPIEYNQIKDLDYWDQIAGQIHYLKSFYYKELENLPERNKLIIKYEEMCNSPGQFLKKLQEKVQGMGSTMDLINQPSIKFDIKKHEMPEEKEVFKARIRKFRNKK